MNKLQLLRLLRKHIRLSEKRSLTNKENKAAKFFIYLGGAFVVLYLIFISVMLALISFATDSLFPYEFLAAIVPILLVFEFFLRFIAQQTPAQLVKPYSLLPIPRYACVEMFIMSSIISPNNLIWLAITVPYAIMTTLFSYGFFTALGIIVSVQLLVTINSQWYMLARTLIKHNLLWWLLPIGFYGLLVGIVLLVDFDTFLDFVILVGGGFANWNPLCYIAALLVLAGFVEANKRIQYRYTYLETAEAEEKKLKTVSHFSMFDRYGEIGEYLKLEAKSLMRNKNMRTSFISATVVVILMSVNVSFLLSWEGSFRTFWTMYSFIIYGTGTLLAVMSPEGNYIECLMTHKENIMQLLKAKYYFHSVMLIIPFLIMLPSVFTGVYTLLALLGMMMFTAGPIHCLMMQMAVYNRQTTPLNNKLTRSGGAGVQYVQLICIAAVFSLPMIFLSMLELFFSEQTAFAILLVVGILFVATHNIWIKNIYHRFMKRRYKNIESFMATR